MTSGRMYRPPGAMVGGTSYRQLRSLRSLASGYGYVALRADDAACGGFVAPGGRCRWGVASYRQLQIVVVDGKIPAITYIY